MVVFGGSNRALAMVGGMMVEGWWRGKREVSKRKRWRKRRMFVIPYSHVANG